MKLPRATAKEYKEVYERELQKYSQLYASNLTQQDTALLQVSVGVLAALATFGNEILLANKVLGVASLALMTVTIFSVILGYLTSNIFLVAMQAKLQQNYLDGSPLNKGFDLLPFGRFNRALSLVTVPAFLAGLVLIFILIALYIFEVKWI